MKVLSDRELAILLDYLADQEQFVFLDTARPGPDNGTSFLFLRPLRRLCCHAGDDAGLFLAQVESALASGYHVAGWFAYEFGYLLEKRLRGLLSRPGDGALPLADLGVFAEPFVFDHRTGACGFPCFRQSSGNAFPAARPVSPIQVQNHCRVKNIRPSQGREDYLRAIAAIRRYIEAGDTYQVNYTLKLLFDFDESPEALYAMLRRNQSVAYGAYVHLGETRILSFSPELFFQKKNDWIMVRPMKGTMQRGRFAEEDQRLAEQLRQDGKNISENVMIVDLLRNDLGRLMRDLDDGPVQTRSLFDIERYETLFQMTSTIVATSDRGGLAGLPLRRLFEALFPCGSVTGAPKVRTMEIIAELEPGRRGVYTGAIGYLAPSGEALFSVPIRTITLRGSQGEMGIGSGIVADSNPEQEWRECQLKGRFLSASAPGFELIETLLWEPDTGYWLLEDHLHRLALSADYFLFHCDLPDVAGRLREHSGHFAARPMRVRLTLAKDGGVAITSQPCSLPRMRNLPLRPDLGRADLPRIEVSPLRIDSSSPFVFHKTTRREIYDSELRRVRAKGMLDCCFLNERSELTEGCIANIILYRQGVYVAPYLQSGVLAGVMRKQLLADRQVVLQESVLTFDDLRRAEAVFLCNSVRGVVQVQGNWQDQDV